MEVRIWRSIRALDRVYFDGVSLIAINGKVQKTTKIFSVEDVEVITAELDLDEVRNHKINLKARQFQAAKTKHFPRVDIDFKLVQHRELSELHHPVPLDQICKDSVIQIAESAGCYLWDYLRRSGASGYFLPLSGGADSAASATCVYMMCQKVVLTSNSNISLAIPRVASRAPTAQEDCSISRLHPQESPRYHEQGLDHRVPQITKLHPGNPGQVRRHR